MSSHSEASDLKLFHKSMVKMVLELLKMEVSDDMRAAIITAIIRPRRPGNIDAQICMKDIEPPVVISSGKADLTRRQQLHHQFGISNVRATH